MVTMSVARRTLCPTFKGMKIRMFSFLQKETGAKRVKTVTTFFKRVYSILRFDRDGLHLEELANAVQTKLHAYKADDPAGMGEVCQGQL